MDVSLELLDLHSSTNPFENSILITQGLFWWVHMAFFENFSKISRRYFRRNSYSSFSVDLAALFQLSEPCELSVEKK